MARFRAFSQGWGYRWSCHFNGQAVLEDCAKSLGITKAELLEALIRRCLPELLQKMMSECNDYVTKRKAQEWTLKNCLGSALRRRAGAAIKLTRKKRFLTVRQLAEAAGWRVWKIHAIENGNRNCNPKNARILAKILKYPDLDLVLKSIGWLDDNEGTSTSRSEPHVPSGESLVCPQ